jgi:hypothetical protein
MIKIDVKVKNDKYLRMDGVIQWKVWSCTDLIITTLIIDFILIKKTICHYASPTMEDLHSSSLQLPSFDPWAIFTNKKETTPFHFCATTAVVSPPSWPSQVARFDICYLQKKNSASSWVILIEGRWTVTLPQRIE